MLFCDCVQDEKGEVDKKYDEGLKHTVLQNGSWFRGKLGVNDDYIIKKDEES
jgi:hypothetical protein